MESDDVLRLLQEVAAEVVDPRFGSLSGADVDRKGLASVVTVADREAEVRIGAVLRSAYPGALVLGEEAAAADATLRSAFSVAEHAFTVDPVDGTRQFVRGSPDHALMVAEVRSGEVVRSWIWQPQHGRSFVAERGAGAYADGARIVPASRPRSWLTATCCGIDYPRLATGEARLAVWPKTEPWDHAPGSLLLTEAGGRVRSATGRTYRPGDPEPRLLVATAPDRP